MSKPKAAREAAAPIVQALDIDALSKEINAKRSYPGTQQNLYSYSKLGWDNYMVRQPAFKLYNTEFTEELAQKSLAAIVLAESLPSFEALRSGHVIARNDLLKMTQPVLNDWSKLKVYIILAFSKTDQPAMLTAAGSDYYLLASRKSWDSVETLARMAETFMAMHGPALLAKGMPEDFPAAFRTAKDAFVAQRTVFKDKEKTAQMGIRNKFEANEAIYAGLVRMTEAGKVIYKTDDFERNNFIISRLLKEVRGNSPSGIKGTITTGTMPVVPLATCWWWTGTTRSVSRGRMRMANMNYGFLRAPKA